MASIDYAPILTMKGFGGMLTFHDSFFMGENARKPKLHHKMAQLGLLVKILEWKNQDKAQN